MSAAQNIDWKRTRDFCGLGTGSGNGMTWTSERDIQFKISVYSYPKE